MDAKCKCVNKPKKCRTNLAISNPKKQITTQRKSVTLNFKFNIKFSANHNDRNSILRACGAHSHKPVSTEMAQGETGNLLHLPTRNVVFLKQKI